MKSILHIFAVLIASTFMSSCSANEPKTECQGYAKTAITLNATELLNAAGVCWADGEKDSSAYLQNLGQIRALTDMTLYKPTKADEGKVTELYTQLYYQFGGPGDDLIFRSGPRYNKLILKIKDAPLSNDNGYSPGWNYKSSSKTELYSEFLNDTKAMRLWQLENFIRLISNDVYFEANTALNELKKDNPSFTVGTEAHDEYQKLRETMERVASTIEQLPPPKEKAPYHLLMEIDNEANYNQIDTKFNGPKTGEIEFFQNAESVLNSWLSRSYEAAELKTILDSINFDEDVLMVLSIGKMSNHSGKIVLNTFEKKDGWDSYSVGINVGVISPSCNVADNDSFPFILATAPKIKDIQVTSRSRSNFPDECGPVASGVAVIRD